MFRHLLETARKYVAAKRRSGRVLRDIEEALRKLACGVTDIDLSGSKGDDDIGRMASSLCSLAGVLQSARQSETELRRSLAEKSRWLELMPAALLVERDGLIVTCTPDLERMFGYSRGELSGRHCRCLFAADADPERPDADCGRGRAYGEPSSGEAELRRKDGGTFEGAFSVAFDCDGNDKVWIFRQSEHTHRKGGYGNGARSDIERQSFDPSGMLEGVAATAAPQAAEKGVELVLEIDSRLPATLLGDPLRVAQALTGLLGHAIRIAEQGEVVVEARESSRQDGKLQVEFRVRAPGGGAAREHEAVCLRANGQRVAHPCDERAIGLAIARPLVASIGGILAVESEDAGGASFHFTTAFAVAAQAAERANDRAESLQSWAGRSVMLIEDKRSARLAIGALLSRLGLTAVLFESGMAALNSLAVPGVSDYLFICVDRRMPGMDGLEVARRLRAHYGAACPPLLLMGGFGPAVELQGAEHGFAAVVSKPLTIERLANHVVALLGAADPKPQAHPAIRLSGKSALLVRKDGIQREIMADFLRAAGISVRVAADALEALQAVRERVPDCLVLDCSSPGADTRELVGGLRALGYLRLPIIGLSTGETNCPLAGVNEFVADSAGLPALLAVLARWMAPPVRSAVADYREEALPPLPPELDVESGLRHLRGKTALFLKALRMFRDNCGQKFQLEFRAAVRAGDWRTSERLAHSLKGTAATIGANQVSAAAARLEAAIRSSDYAQANALLAELSTRLKNLVEGLAHIG